MKTIIEIIESLEIKDLEKFKKHILLYDESEVMEEAIIRAVNITAGYAIIRAVNITAGYDIRKNNKRTREVANYRMIASYLLYTEAKLNYSQIGRILKRNHATIMHHIKRFDDHIQYCDVKKEYNKIMILI